MEAPSDITVRGKFCFYFSFHHVRTTLGIPQPEPVSWAGYAALAVPLLQCAHVDRPRRTASQALINGAHHALRQPRARRCRHCHLASRLGAGRRK